MRVHHRLGMRLVESVYENALAFELRTVHSIPFCMD